MTEMKILCVDDEPFNLDLLSERLEMNGYSVGLAENGQQALDALIANPDQYEAVLLDRMMPDINGLEVLQQIKSHPELKHIPIIMQTAMAGKEDIRDGLEAGAYYYLTKPFDKHTLLAIVKTAVDDYRRFQQIQTSIKDTTSVLQSLKEGTFTFRTTNEAKKLSTVLANAAPNSERIVTGLFELMLNAIEHGNLGISYAEKSTYIEEGSLADEIERRLQSEKYGKRCAEVSLKRNSDRIELSIVDQGDGFEWDKYLDFDPDRAFDRHGRGIMMANKMSFDKLEYQGIGNHVVATIPIQK